MIEDVVFVKTVHKIKRHQIGYYLDYMFKSNVTVIQSCIQSISFGLEV